MSKGLFSQLDFKFFQSSGRVICILFLTVSISPYLNCDHAFKYLTIPFPLGKVNGSKVLELLTWIKDKCTFYNIIDTSGVSSLLASLGHTGRRVALDHTLNIQTLTQIDGKKGIFCKKKKILFIYSFVFRQRGREGERGEKHQCVVASPSGATLTGDLASNPGMCPGWELNQRPFGSQAGAQSTEPHHQGTYTQKVLSKFKILCWSSFIAILGHMWPMGHRLDTPAYWENLAVIVRNLSKIIDAGQFERLRTYLHTLFHPKFPSEFKTTKTEHPSQVWGISTPSKIKIFVKK